MEKNNINKPCLIKLAQGFSVSYHERFLYSKYSPSKSILQTVSSLKILSGSLILCLSPVLPHGILELIEKLPQDCLLLGVEFDGPLYDFIQTQISDLQESSVQQVAPELSDLWKKIYATQKFTFLSQDEIYRLPEIINRKQYTLKNGFTLPPAGTFRRVICINFSAGIQFHADLYSQLQQSCVNAMMTLWGNIATLTKFGHNYSKNFFSNLKLLPKSTPIQKYFSTVEKAIVVFGAGLSIDSGIKEIAGKRNDFFILCVDTAFQTLLKNSIIPDGVFIEETQQIITKAFTGTLNAVRNQTQIFAGLSSISRLTHNFPPEKISFFTTIYSDTSFINKLDESELLPPSNHPMGSVGLTTVHYALQFRKNYDIPVFIYGLDFSYKAGITHGKGTPTHIRQLLAANRLVPVQNYGSAYSAGTKTVVGKKDTKVITTHILNSYAEMFNSIFVNQINIFDSAEQGLPLFIPRKAPEKYVTSPAEKSSFENNISKSVTALNSTSKSTSINSRELSQSKIDSFFNQETAALIELRSILTGEIKLTEVKRNNRIIELLKDREYLYLHFPDGWKISTDIAFLKRVRAEIEVFIKIFS